ncbi:MAG: pentapeptide repeat-containing protein [Chthoniobacter sp.]|nr:pentapeptide repeat-containing protein [Chthoniobacter sp.]
MVVFSVVALLASVFPLHSQESSGKPEISEADFMNAFKNGDLIKGKKIDAEFIASALEWAEKNPTQLAPFFSLHIEACEVNNDLALADRNINIPVAIHETTFLGSLHCAKARFQEPINLAGCRFHEPVVFDAAVFADLIDFSNVTFQSLAYFNDATFEREVFFPGTAFNNSAGFDGTRFKGTAKFESSVFSKDANFRKAVFDGYLRFQNVTIGGSISFREATLTNHVTFADTTFQKDVFFDDIEGMPNGMMEFFGVIFKGRTYFDDSKIRSIRFSPRFSSDVIREAATGVANASYIEELFSRRFYSPTVFEKIAVFRNLEVSEADFSEAEFQDYVDYIGARFRERVEFFDTTFKSEVNFREATFPSIRIRTSDNNRQIVDGLLLDRVHFRDQVSISWNQLVQPQGWWQFWRESPVKVYTVEPSTWYALEEVFRKSDNLKGRNEAKYQERLLSGTSGGPDKENSFINGFSWLFWGYGYRPWRTVIFSIACFALFTGIYWKLMLPPVYANVRKLKRERFKDAVAFSLRTSWELGHGLGYAQTWPLKSLLIADSIISKIMLFCLLDVIANVSPLLNALIGKILPV